MKNKLILASASPRRLDLLEQIGLTPDAVTPADIDESWHPHETPRDYALRMATEKAQAISGNKTSYTNGHYILAADTVVAMGRRILPKTETPEQTRSCLERLSGRRHHVYGGIALITPEGKCLTRLVDTIVQFKRLTAPHINHYLETGEWSGVAGGYAIQGYADCFVKSLRGSYSNIVGLSLYDTMNLLEGSGFFRTQ